MIEKIIKIEKEQEYLNLKIDEIESDKNYIIRRLEARKEEADTPDKTLIPFAVDEPKLPSDGNLFVFFREPVMEEFYIHIAIEELPDEKPYEVLNDEMMKRIEAEAELERAKQEIESLKQQQEFNPVVEENINNIEELS
ncbi:MAG: hypothetical protein LBM02_09420 [Lachnospiraceae bacterium]|jgi:hypothetical protein|nr:hypothetical protein [Lachnospiraceae bacterium]